MRQAALVALLALSCGTNFWAFHNTFYNADKAFRSAQKKYREGDTTSALPLYTQTITKCTRLISRYPSSKYVDDALYMMGISYSRTGELSKAETKFLEYLEYYPRGTFAPEVLVELGRIMILRRKANSARSYLSEAERYGGETLIKARYFRAMSFSATKEWTEAAEAYGAFVEKNPKHYLAKKAQLEGSEAAKEAKEFELAVRLLNLYLGNFLTEDEKLRARELLGDIHCEWGHYSEAERTYKALDIPSTSQDYWRIQVKSGLAIMGRGDTSSAMAVWQGVIDNATEPVRRSQAYYYLGYSLEKMGEVERAVEMYDSSKVLSSDTIATKAKYRSDALTEYNALRGNDSTAAQTFRLAELAYFRLSRPALALMDYRKVTEQYPKDLLAPKALYALVYLNLHVTGDTAAAREALEALSSGFSKTIYAEEARARFGASF